MDHQKTYLCTVPALIQLAKRSLNTGCTYDSSQAPLAGSFNWAVVLSFDDGVEWLLRSPRTTYALDETTTRAVIASEVATLRYIKQNSSIPVPNRVRIGHNGSCGLLKAEQKQKVMVQLGKVMDQFSQLLFDKIRSLFEEEGRFRVKSCLLPSFLFHNRYELQGICRGPFSEENEYYRALLSVYCGHIQHLSLGHHALFTPVPVPKEYDCYDSYLAATDRWNGFVTLGSRVENSGNRLDYFIAGQFLEKMIPRLTNNFEEFKDRHMGRFTLYHPDLSANNIFVDEECNITCIIDWGFVSTVPVDLLLATPGLPHPRGDLDLSLTSAFRSGFTDRSYPISWEMGRMLWLFMRLVNMDSLQDYHLLAELYTLTYSSQATLLLHAFNEQYSQPAITDMRNILSANDETAADIARHEKGYFSNMSLQRYTVARKIDLASKLNTIFVADKRLWLWIEKALSAD
ncbi:protein kinase subdomain-containing protein [Nannizzia gypsea CBS 118893]|uniref:Protein kinase subdomain-containing protein n=1 Tax=Arthroderma gypseum (strain ATCC MYA-4604 / CBS 118893) TaxID=535722 RepID=E4V2L5_ARTGP|nr:protein kinase subdomain-containing protein [Nannizzia gypsea CBS 118893]EFR04280.1 protein kinase subdomain-containing protein [Nannizzia gypsea CBS 118893]